jgi:hypothetical protein
MTPYYAKPLTGEKEYIASTYSCRLQTLFQAFEPLQRNINAHIHDIHANKIQY